ncbi:alpha/beta hydrolase [Janibacter sp. Soil728]|uniref:alpha/beta fold hydrolase n=1 Tax=Janibacter sp. Soil728 TaxID=1736393 RepID=UPI0006F7A70A|nr:alpha/beta hydrolase [Janibacter sp. Soil728]KRE39576.1 alpha/beta hydrolase [Janibacter sp. Soil728]
MPTKNAEVTSRDIALGDVTYRVHSTGEPGMPPLLLLHGSGPGATGTSNWKAVIEELGDRYHCIAPDMIGFGDSTHLEDPPRGMKALNAVQARTLFELLDALEVPGKATLVGNSMGGMISLEMALIDADRVGPMLLMGSGGAPDLPVTEGLQHLFSFYADPTAASMKQLLSSFVYDIGVLGDKVDEVAAERMPYIQREDIKRSHAAMFDPQAPKPGFTAEEMASIPHKVLCVHGRDDIIVPVQSSTWLAQNLPDANLHIIPKTGHWTQIEAHDTFIFLLESLVAGKF